LPHLSPRIRCDDLVVEAGETAPKLGDQHELKNALPAARRLDRQLAVAGQRRLGEGALRWLVVASGLSSPAHSPGGVAQFRISAASIRAFLKAIPAWLIASPVIGRSETLDQLLRDRGQLG
jgi:hypothetical protein